MTITAMHGSHRLGQLLQTASEKEVSADTALQRVTNLPFAFALGGDQLEAIADRTSCSLLVTIPSAEA